MTSLGSMLQAEFGTDFEDIHASLPHHPTKNYTRRALSDIEFGALHHTDSPSATEWKAVAAYHVNDPKHQWPGIAYHIGIRDFGGRCIVSLLNLPETRSFHAHTVGNDRGLAFVIAGRKNTEPVTPAELNALTRAVKVARRWATWCQSLPILGHGQVPGNDTTCPGKYLKEIIPMLNTRVIRDPRLQAAVWKAAKGKQTISPNGNSAIMKFMKEQEYFAIGQEVDVLLDDVWQGTTQLGYQYEGDEDGVAFFATNLTEDGQWGVSIMEAPETE